MDLTVEAFAEAVGPSGPVTIAGAGTRGGGVDGVRTVTAPAGIARIDAAEMVVECGAATPVDEVTAALAEVGQCVSLPPGGTVGGALAVGRSDITRLGYGAMRDALLMAHYVDAEGAVVKAGGPTVKNVSGFDLCRLLVGSHGSIGFLATVLLRTRPLARRRAWFVTQRDPVEILTSMYRPVSVLWDGTSTWVRVDGEDGDVSETAHRYQLDEVDGPPPLPSHRWSVRPADLEAMSSDGGPFVAEMGVGIVHRDLPQPPRPASDAILALHRRIADSFDPTDRLNPGRSALEGC